MPPERLRRMKTMSDRALETRVHRITNIDKLRSFIQVPDAIGNVPLYSQSCRCISCFMMREPPQE